MAVNGATGTITATGTAEQVAAVQFTVARPALSGRARTYRLGLLSVLLLTGLWRLAVMVQWSWWVDDWTFIGRTESMSFWDYVTQIYNGHLQPGQFAIVWGITKVAPLDYRWAIAAVWLISMLSLIVWALLFRQIFGERWAALVGVIPVALAPGFVPVVAWTAAGLTSYVLQLFMGLTLLCSLGWMRYRSSVALVLTVVSFVVGLAFWEKGLLTTIPVVGLGLLLCRDDGGRLRLRRLTTLVLAVAIPSLIYVAVYLSAIGGGSTKAASWVLRDFGDVVLFYWAALTQSALPALAGGPWPAASQTYSGLLLPTTAAQWLVLAATIALLVWGIARRRRGWIPVATALGYFVVSMGLVVFSSRYEFAGLFAAFDFRYPADSVVVFALMGTLLLVPALGEADPLRRDAKQPWRIPAWVAPGVAVALVAMAVGTSSALWDGFLPKSPKSWVDNLIRDARAAGPASVVDSNARPDVINAYLAGDDARLSRMLAPLHLPLRWNQPAQHLLMITDDGTLRQAQVTANSMSPTGPVPLCGYLVQPGQKQSVRMSGNLFPWEWGLEVGYYSKDGGTLVLSFDTTEARIPVAAGLGSVQTVVHGGIHTITMSSTADSAPICVGAIKAGNLTPVLDPVASASPKPPTTP